MSQDHPSAGTIVIAGCGFVGRSWAIVFARSGHNVRLYDPDARTLAAAPALMAAALAELASFGLIEEAPDAIMARVSAEPDLPAALADADYVQESAPEQIEIKRALFAELERHSPRHTILASSSSSITCTDVCGDLETRDRCLVAHPANPPHLLPAVEIVPASFTATAAVDRAVALLRDTKQVPVVIREIDGFVMNRLQAALAGEALALVEAGIADAGAIDAIVRHSLGLRWAFMGPFETMDLNAPGGFRDYAERYGPAFAALAGADAWPAAAVTAVDADLRSRQAIKTLDARRAWRDQRLAALVAHMA